MKIFGLLVVTMSVTIVLACSMSYAAPACCDPSQSQNMIKPPGPASDMGNRRTPGVATTKSAPRASQQPPGVMPQIPYGPPAQAKRPVAPAPVRLGSLDRPVGSVEARAAGGCCAGAKNLSAAPSQTAGRGCGGTCPSCFSRSNAARPTGGPSIQPGLPVCCAERATNSGPAVQTQLKEGRYAPAKPVLSEIKTVHRIPATLTATPGANRSQAPRFVTLW
jgi:hypothetical protein